MFYYYGAKNLLARYYPEPKHNLIIEPFAGSAAYSVYHLHRNIHLNALLIEKDIVVHNLWKWLFSCTEEDIITYPVPKIGEYTTDFFIMTCAVSNAVSKCKKLKFSTRLERVFEIQKKRILKLFHIRNRIEIKHANYDEVENDCATWFIDPPYQVQNTNPNTIFAHGNGYSKICNSDCLDYVKLGEWCQEREGQVIACE